MPTRTAPPHASGGKRIAARASADGQWPAPMSALFASQPGHEPALDGLRGISSVFVLFFHCATWLPAAFPEAYRLLPGVVLGFWRQSWFGVDVFFVLSGFLIGRILLRRLTNGPLGFRAFYIRRTFRIFPIYYLVLGCSVFVFSRIAAWGILFGRQTVADTIRGSWANFLYVSNYAYGMQRPNALSWGWSLCVEEHFYLILPAFLALFFAARLRRALPFVLVALAAVPTLCRWAMYSRSPDMIVFPWIHPMSHTHADGLVLGVLVAYATVFHRERLSSWMRRLGHGAWILGVCGIAATMIWGGLRVPGPYPVIWQYFVTAAGATLLMLNGLYLDNACTRFLSAPIWAPLARTSYATYLIQMFVIYWQMRWWPVRLYDARAALVSAFGFNLTVLATCFAITSGTYLLVEKPLLDRGARLAKKHLPGIVPARS